MRANSNTAEDPNRATSADPGTAPNPDCWAAWPETPALSAVTDVLIASARLGAPAGPALARLGEETRSALRRQAEARARTLPVKLLFPLVFLVLPAFGLLTLAPAVISALHRL